MFPWIPLLEIGSGLLGTIFGNQENNQTSQNSTGTTGTTSALHSTGTTGQLQRSGTTSLDNSMTATHEAGTTDSTQVGNTSRLDANTLAELTQSVQSMMKGATGNKGVVDNRLNEVASTGKDFDVEGFVNGIMKQAGSRATSSLESGTSAITANSGGTVDSNSMSALLENRLRQDTADNLAGIQSNATAQGEQIRRTGQESKTGQITALNANSNDSLATLLQSLTGATQKDTVTGNQATTTDGTQHVVDRGHQNSTVGTTQQETNTQAQTQAQVTNSNVTQTDDKQTHNWADFFKGLGDMFGATF